MQNAAQSDTLDQPIQYTCRRLIVSFLVFSVLFLLVLCEMCIGLLVDVSTCICVVVD